MSKSERKSNEIRPREGVSYLWTMIQEIFVGVIFLSALAFLGSMFYRNLQAKEGCVSGCGKCSADFSKLGDGSVESAVRPRL
jgi:hypothetical protein